MATDALTGEVTELLQQLIRNRCVNDGTPEGGQEVRNADLLTSYLEGAGLECARFEPTPGRASLVARVEGSDPTAPTVCLMGHTDVVPVNAAGWREDPFGGELIDGEVWGRGAVDMLNLTASMAVAVRHLARDGFQPRGTLVYLAVADEESGGAHGAGWLADHAWDAIGCDYVLTEMGGMPLGGGERPALVVHTAEKGFAWRTLVVRGTPGHGSMPFGADSALVKAAEVVRRLSAYRPRARIGDLWAGQVAALGLPDDLRAALVDPDRIEGALDAMPAAAARYAHASTHTTFSPNVVRGGVKTNVICDRVEIDVDIRTLPGETPDDVVRHLQDALGDLAAQVDVVPLTDAPATTSPQDTPMWDALSRAAKARYPDAELVPGMIIGLTDARFFRQKGAVAYGAGLYGPDVSFAEFGARFHGNDERIDLESLRLSTELWLDVTRHILG